MRAVRIHGFGGPEVLGIEDIPLPQPGAGEIRIRIIAAGVNPFDWKVRRGYMPIPLPVTLGLDVSGVVDALGDEVEAFEIGDGVYAKMAFGQGGYAEYAVTDASFAAAKPKSIGFVEAAAIPTACLAAWQAIFDIAGLEEGQNILIHGAAGGVGSFAVQLAIWKGASVTGTASEDHIQFVENLGAERVIDYKKERFEEIAHDMDVVLDTVGGDTFDRSWAVLEPGGFLVTTVAKIPEGAAAEHKARAALLAAQPNGEELARIAQIIDEGYIRPQVTSILPLEEVRQAHEMSESGHMKGKIVLRVTEDPA